MVLKGLEFRLEAPNPLTYVETLLEVLGKISYFHTYARFKKSFGLLNQHVMFIQQQLE